MARPHHNLLPELAVPPTAAMTLRMVEGLTRSARFSDRIGARAQPLVGVDFGSALIHRLSGAEPLGVWAANLAQRFTFEPRQLHGGNLPLAFASQHMRRAPAVPLQRWSQSPPSLVVGQEIQDASRDSSSAMLLRDDLSSAAWGEHRAGEGSGPTSPGTLPAARSIVSASLPVPPSGVMPPAQRSALSPTAAPLTTSERAAPSHTVIVPPDAMPTFAQSNAALPLVAGPTTSANRAQASPVENLSVPTFVGAQPATATSASTGEAAPDVRMAGARPTALFRPMPLASLQRMGISQTELRAGGEAARSGYAPVGRQSVPSQPTQLPGRSVPSPLAIPPGSGMSQQQRPSAAPVPQSQRTPAAPRSAQRAAPSGKDGGGEVRSAESILSGSYGRSSSGAFHGACCTTGTCPGTRTATTFACISAASSAHDSGSAVRDG